MNEQPQAPDAAPLPFPEIVGTFSSREDLEAAVKTLRAAGFGHTDLSILDTHESLDAFEQAPWYEHFVGLVGEAKYIGPLTTADFWRRDRSGRRCYFRRSWSRVARWLCARRWIR